jgi:multidrug efflux system membrane fusion protein
VNSAIAVARANAAVAHARVQAATAGLELAKLQLSYTKIKAPSTGRVGLLQVDAGNMVRQSDANGIVVINQVVPVNVSFAVPEQSLPSVRKYDADGELQVTAQVPNSGEKPIAGKLSFIDNSTDVSTGTIKLKAEFKNQDKALWPGQFVDVVMTLTEQQNAVVVPTTAIQNGPNGQYVFIVKDDHTVDLRDVKVARAEGNVSVIATGLTPGETVVTVGQLRLAPGTKVSIAEAKASV